MVPTLYQDKDQLERIQRHFTKMIQAMQSLPYEERLSRTGLWTLEDRRVRADLTQVYKIIHDVLSVSFDTFLNFLSPEDIH